MKNASFANKTRARIEALPDTAETVRGQVNIEFAKTALKANLSPGSLSNILHVTRASVHGWINGRKISRSRAVNVLMVIKALREDIARGVLPKASKEERQAYEQAFTVGDFFEKTLAEKLEFLNLDNPELERWLLGKD